MQVDFVSFVKGFSWRNSGDLWRHDELSWFRFTIFCM